MGLKEKILKKMKKIKTSEKVGEEYGKEFYDDVSNNKFLIDLEKIIQDMYERGVKVSTINPVESLLGELEKKIIANSLKQEEKLTYQKIIGRIKSMPKEELEELKQKLSDELELDEQEGER